MDFQSVKTTGPAKERGYDEKNERQKKHITVDTTGNLLSIVVHFANLSDTKQGYKPSEKLINAIQVSKDFVQMLDIVELLYAK